MTDSKSPQGRFFLTIWKSLSPQGNDPGTPFGTFDRRFHYKFAIDSLEEIDEKIQSIDWLAYSVFDTVENKFVEEVWRKDKGSEWNYALHREMITK